MAKLSTKNIEKAIRAIGSKYIRKTVDCFHCGKRIKNGEEFYASGPVPSHGECLVKEL
jgi:hypothetical protein